ncbi:MAG: EAL domain-containing protein [Gammaproteobacteria bacterium]|nr:EAL domain-containing protein [Gammaproteobacteria bacterium]MCW5583622.1 EAL domain-containing protein [Gammaproteobacteria bacterium]
MIKNFSHEIHVELVKLLFQQIKFALWAESIAAIGLTLALWSAINHNLLIVWLACNLLFCGLARHVMVFCYERAIARSPLTYEKAYFWLGIFAAGALISGISWGLTGSVLMVKNDVVRQTFEVFLLIGVTAAANSYYSPYRSIYTIFLLPAFVPFAVWLMLQGGVLIILGVLAVIYIIIMLTTSFYLSRLISTSLYLRFENMDLVKHLSRAKNALENRSRELEKSLSLLHHQANFDLLTELPNRALAFDRISQAIANAKRSQLQIAILFVDLDRFKLINDTLGHLLGDKLLQVAAQRLTNCVRENDTVSRVGGDEFLIILTSFKNDIDAVTVARKCLDIFSEPFLIDGNKFNISLSIGVSFYPKDGSEAEVLIRKADVAMYRAKELGRNNFQFYAEEMDQKIQVRSTIENLLREAFHKNELSLLYQPMASLKTGRPIGMEALLHWKHPQLGVIPPSSFILAAEENGMIIPIGEWVLRTACKQMSEWHKIGFVNLQIAVNLSARQFKQENLVEQISKILDEVKLDPSYLILELTESAIMDDVRKNIEILNKLREIGVMVAIDDFGMGYANLRYLKWLPISKLKIDFSFIKDIEKYTDGATITAAIIALANKLNFKVIAEGVENDDQLSFLIKHHCDEIQGFYFSKPLDAKACSKFLSKNPVLQLPEYV